MAYERRAWRQAFDGLAAADQETPLGADDLVRLGMSAALIGEEQAFHGALERAHHLQLEAGDPESAARWAFWLGLRLASAGEMGPASGWFGRAGRLLDRDGRDCAERGFLLIPSALGHLASGAYEAAYADAVRAAECGERFGEPDLVALGMHLQGRALLHQERFEDGLSLLDEAMVAVAAGELSPPITGLIYCSMIGTCRRVFELRRAHEWTAALAEWCDGQPEMVAFTGECLALRAEVLQLSGAWHEAIEEAGRACERFANGSEPHAAAGAFYRRGEVHRLLGGFERAEEAYRSASHWGWEPQPGLALLRLAQGNTEAAAASIRRVMEETTDRMRRARLLPAYVEIMLAEEDLGAARQGARELEEIARAGKAEVLETMAAHASGAVALADGDPRLALTTLRRAWEGWRSLGAPYESARVRVLLGLACRALGDREGAVLELDAARRTFDDLGAGPDLRRLEALSHPVAGSRPHGLTKRELEVLRHLASGKTNRTIAADLFISERTVDRHVSNLFTKLGVSSRAAATAFAYENELL